MGKYTLIVTEKPDAAARIASALDVLGKPERNQKSGVPYFRAQRNGEIVVVPAIGHLYTITSRDKMRGYPVFDYEWVPRWQAEKGASKIRTWLKVISELAADAESFVDGCDFDIEGSIIGYTILKYACGEKQQVAKRMKYSTLTTEELQQSYERLMPKLDFALVEAGLTRHEIDWLYGINLSRALTTAAKEASGQYATLSTGRVQGPTLRFLEEREKEILCFVPTPYWKLTAKISMNGTTVAAEYPETLETLKEATELKEKSKAKQGKIEAVKVTESLLSPPVPFDLGALQSEAYKLFHLTPMRTLTILQRLYIGALISYPRTSSQKLPPSIGYRSILKKLRANPAYNRHTAELLTKKDLKPNEGKKIDPAHPAIYPTGNLPQKPLDDAPRNVFDLVVKRFLAVFAEPALRQNVDVTVSISGVPFGFSLARTLSEGWMKFYKPYVQVKDDALPTLSEGQQVYVKRVTLKEHYTQPPPRYNPRSLLQKMEKEEIGTKATRAVIIETLQERKYLRGTDNFAVSALGFEVVEVLQKYCPIVVSSEMTRNLEERMDLIQQGKENKQAVLAGAVETLKTATAELRTKEKAVGVQLSQALQRARLEERTVGFCPNCKSGQLLILHSKKTGKRFVGCNNYFQGKCSTTYPLPQTGMVKPLANPCKSCGAPVVSVYMRARKPWRLCLNPQCPSKGAAKP
ncbi:MAG: DNA topoisomerase I [Candidatus Bathyarchaeota archaeon]|nr:DNA topoisomerase I [Candidatus Bathyarchaeota archaeon]